MRRNSVKLGKPPPKREKKNWLRCRKKVSRSITSKRQNSAKMRKSGNVGKREKPGKKKLGKKADDCGTDTAVAYWPGCRVTSRNLLLIGWKFDLRAGHRSRDAIRCRCADGTAKEPRIAGGSVRLFFFFPFLARSSFGPLPVGDGPLIRRRSAVPLRFISPSSFGPLCRVCRDPNRPRSAVRVDRHSFVLCVCFL